ncbi:MAG: hypothetical protein Kow0031_10240 [Anaerolineae bacterium]
MIMKDAFKVQPGPGVVSDAGQPLAANARLAVICPGADTPVYTYALHLAELLDAKTRRLAPEQEADLPELTTGSDLLVVHAPPQSRLKSWLCGSAACRLVNRLPVSVLVVEKPRWPLKKILLLTRGRRLDFAAASWVAHLARPISAEIAVLAVQPYLAAANCQAMFGQGIDTWLASDTPLGQQLRHILNLSDTPPRRLQLQFRGGSPDRQVRQAVLETQPDLIVIAAETGYWCERRILGELVRPLLQQTRLPVLVAKFGFFPGRSANVHYS